MCKTALRLAAAAAGATLLAAAAGAQIEDDTEGVAPEVYVRPVYPAGAEIDANCAAWFNVQADGAVDPLSVAVNCTPDPGFAPAVKTALAQWRFEPTLIDGEPAPVSGYSARIFFTDGRCVRVISGNFVDTPCALRRK